MKSNQDLKTLNLEELMKKSSIMQTATWTLAALLLMLFGLSFYFFITGEKMVVMMAVPFALSPILILNFRKIKEIKVEIRSRNKQVSSGGTDA